MREKRKEIIKRRKNFLPTLVFTLLFWSLAAGLVYFVDPDAFGAVFLFFALVFIATLFTSSLIFADSRRGIITASGLTLFFILRYFGIGNILNFLLIAGLALTTELYLAKR